MKKNSSYYHLSVLLLLLTAPFFLANAQQERSVSPLPVVATSQLLSQPLPVFAYGITQLILMSAEGVQQGQFKGEPVATGQLNKIGVTALTIETNSPRDAATGQASGKATRRPIIINKLLGASSLQFYQALLKNEVLKTVSFEFYETSSGTPKLSYTIKLTNARVSNFKQAINSDSELKGLREEVQLVYQKMEITDASGFIISDDMVQNIP